MPSLSDQTDGILADLLDLLRREAVKAAAVADPARIVHDLQVHQLELELQNRELHAV